MIKLFIGSKGSGKTKNLIEMVNNASATSDGSVICIEKGDKLKLDVTYKARLIDTESYHVSCAASLYGFIAGICASNNDITDIFVDSALKICNNDVEEFKKLLKRVESLDNRINFVMTASIAVEECPDEIKAYA